MNTKTGGLYILLESMTSINVVTRLTDMPGVKVVNFTD